MNHLNPVEAKIVREGFISLEQYQWLRPYYLPPHATNETVLGIQTSTRKWLKEEENKPTQNTEQIQWIQHELHVIGYLLMEFRIGLR